MKKSDREIMEILEAFDATGCANSAASLAGVDPKTVRRYVAKRDAGKPVDQPAARPKLIDPFLPKIEELVETSEGGVRADVVHERLVAMVKGEFAPGPTSHTCPEAGCGTYRAASTLQQGARPQPERAGGPGEQAGPPAMVPERGRT